MHASAGTDAEVQEGSWATKPLRDRERQSYRWNRVFAWSIDSGKKPAGRLAYTQ